MLKFLLLCFLFYLVVRFARNLIRAMVTDGRTQPAAPPHQRQPEFDHRTPPPPWKRPGPSPASMRRATDVEDARWEDLS